MSRVGLYRPLNTLKPVAPGIWTVDGPIVSVAQFGLRFDFPTRMTVIKLEDGGLWCHSPIEPEESLFAAVAALGPVQHLVSPNWLHYVHIATWRRRFPEAIAWASPGVQKRAASQGIPVTFDRDLTDSPPIEWKDDIDQMFFKGSSVMREVIFFHRASATIIVADLIENFEPTKISGFMRWVAKLGGVMDPDGKMPIDYRFTFLRHKTEARASLEQMLAWNPERVILAHGRCYLEDGAAELRRAFRWLV
ncbi:MAG TPA: DUF4336 domain-containing protein [Gammaproteobacteria bacterium]|jgi:hypothetical protein